MSGESPHSPSCPASFSYFPSSDWAGAARLFSPVTPSYKQDKNNYERGSQLDPWWFCLHVPLSCHDDTVCGWCRDSPGSCNSKLCFLGEHRRMRTPTTCAFLQYGASTSAEGWTLLGLQAPHNYGVRRNGSVHLLSSENLCLQP